MTKAVHATQLVAAVMLSMPNIAAASSLSGTQVTITAYCCSAPISGNAFTVPASAVVGPGIEFPSGSLVTTTLSIITSDVDISDTAIDISYTTTATAGPGAFNGFGFDFAGLSGYAITGVTLNPLSTFAASTVGLSFDEDSVYYSGAGLSFTPSSRILIDVALSPVPSPGANVLLGTGICLLLGGIYRHRSVGAEQAARAGFALQRAC